MLRYSPKSSPVFLYFGCSAAIFAIVCKSRKLLTGVVPLSLKSAASRSIRRAPRRVSILSEALRLLHSLHAVSASPRKYASSASPIVRLASSAVSVISFSASPGLNGDVVKTNGFAGGSDISERLCRLRLSDGFSAADGISVRPLTFTTPSILPESRYWRTVRREILHFSAACCGVMYLSV